MDPVGGLGVCDSFLEIIALSAMGKILPLIYPVGWVGLRELIPKLWWSQHGVLLQSLRFGGCFPREQTNLVTKLGVLRARKDRGAMGGP